LVTEVAQKSTAETRPVNESWLKLGLADHGKGVPVMKRICVLTAAIVGLTAIVSGLGTTEAAAEAVKPEPLLSLDSSEPEPLACTNKSCQVRSSCATMWGKWACFCCDSCADSDCRSVTVCQPSQDKVGIAC
jgi:hypothetical protein